MGIVGLKVIILRLLVVDGFSYRPIGVDRRRTLVFDGVITVWKRTQVCLEVSIFICKNVQKTTIAAIRFHALSHHP